MDSTYNEINWMTDGNRTFKALNIHPSRGFPEIKMLNLPPLIKNKTYYMDISSVISNYDSVTVAFHNPGTAAYFLQKTFSSKKGSVLEFPAAELSPASPGIVFLVIYTFNYSHQIIEGKNYVFQLGVHGGAIVSCVP